jgi:outer membrane protein insertion porin family
LALQANFSSASELFAGIEVSQRNYDWRDHLIFGRGGGQRMKASFDLGSSQSNFLLSFREPWLFDEPLVLDLNAWGRTISTHREWEERSLGFGPRITFREFFGTPLPKLWRASLGYRIESVSIEDVDSSFGNDIGLLGLGGLPGFGEEVEDDFTVEEESEVVSAIALTFTRDHRNDFVLPSSGSKISLKTELQSEAIGSYDDMIKLHATADKYYPIFKRSIFKLSGEIGTITGDPGVWDRYFAGGLNSIRGFEPREVGPVNPFNEETVGGQSILLGSAEYLTPLYEDTLYMAAFVDTGNVWRDSFDWDPGQLNVGAGIGVRIMLRGFGTIQIDYGIPISEEQEHLEGSGRIHFNVGARF